FAKSCDSGSFGAVYLQGEQVVPSYTDRPRRIKLCNDATLQFECGIRRVIRSALVWLALLIDPLRNVGCAEAGNCFDISEYIVEQVTPVTEHVHNNAAVILLSIVP